MNAGRNLVIGASGFLGSHVTRRLVERGDDVRVMLRPTSSTKGINDLDIEKRYGDIFDSEALRTAMEGCDNVFYCVVDTRAWLRDPRPVFRTNVDGLRNVLDVATSADLSKFVFTSTIGTIGIPQKGLATEDDVNEWHHLGGPYIQSRLEAERLVLRLSEEGFPAVAMCVANTYGPGDWQPTPHGSLLAAAAAGKVPFYVNDLVTESVGIDDAAEALILAAEHGRNGHRYIVSERYLSVRDLLTTAALAVGARPPRFGLPLSLVYRLGSLGDVAARMLKRDLLLSTMSVRLLDILPPMDNSKAVKELGWSPNSTLTAVEQAARFFREVASTA
ncbi:NAD-dependent dehydratase [Mycobacterium colombiense]|uniref:NAD-dependent epimerase/dehydratase family protein n=1 Tax=Mycobacterium colombiense TaxID=339268 RepID=UPI0007EFA7A4|nr:NAD-dependent epimerase/dehydratase family protein [Mycobacterium colombiense]OBK63098.1 NAD-dependent dehydratase [Mycobacterium colombiense]